MHVKHLACCLMHNECPSTVVPAFSSPVTKYVILDKLTFPFLKNPTNKKSWTNLDVMAPQGHYLAYNKL